jgi:hypothetical protein
MQRFRVGRTRTPSAVYRAAPPARRTHCAKFGFAAVSFVAAAFAAVAFAAVMFATASAAIAQTPLHIRGDIVAMSNVVPDPPPLRVRLHDGSELVVALAFNFQSTELRAIGHDTLRAGANVGVIAAPAADGTLQAIAVLVYPADYAAAATREEPWDLAAHATMTFATLDAVDVRGGARALALADAGGTRTIVVADSAPVVAMQGSGHTVLAPGTHVFINATRQRDGTITAGRIYFGSGGFTPPL